MAQKKKLQVFVSSTYIDLHEERQAAVQAILTAGHIPAGMELFAAGDETQMKVIKRWIDESDVYMLILGGRYGSIESKSQKSYIHLEYEYAVEKNKPLFAVVIDNNHLNEKVKREGLKVVENDHSEKLKEFREMVCSKMVRFWSDPKDIKLAILETMADIANRAELVGWIPGNETVNTGEVAEEIARLAKENAELREKLQLFQSNSVTYNGLSFEEMYSELHRIKLDTLTGISGSEYNPAENIAMAFYDSEASLLHLFLVHSKRLMRGHKIATSSSHLLGELIKLGLLYRLVLTETGKQFLLRLTIMKRDIIDSINETDFL